MNPKKKQPAASSEGYHLEAFYDRLRDLCAHHVHGAGHDRTRRSKDEAEQPCALGREYGILNSQDLAWADFKSEADAQLGTEHLVEFREDIGLVVKITIPPKFGLIPRVLSHPVPSLRGEPGTRKAIEFIPATPLEYLQRWIAANHIFSDQVRLTSVIQWADGNVSFAISQPQYHGEPAGPRDIERHFRAAGWTPINDPTGQHSLFFNYAFQTLAIDALPRNCYIHPDEDLLLPFDVILCHPDYELEAFLKLYPD